MYSDILYKYTIQSTENKSVCVFCKMYLVCVSTVFWKIEGMAAPQRDSFCQCYEGTQKDIVNASAVKKYKRIQIREKIWLALIDIL